RSSDLFSIETNNFLLISGRLSSLATSSNNTSNLILLSAKSLKKRLTSFVALKTRPIAANSLLLRVPPISNLFKKLLMEIRFGTRSEEHTSELQSRFDLVCRLLLEKKKKY